MHKMFWQSVYSVAVLVAFFIVLCAYLKATTPFQAIKNGSMDILLGGTVFVAFKYWFPTPSKTPATKKTPKG
ncbi:MAG: hypothetical protein RLZZ367_833 [Bacteroidota bacterium]